MPDHKREIDPVPDDIDLKTVYLTAREARELIRNVERHVKGGSNPEQSLMWRMKQAETDIKDNSADISRIKSIPLRLAWVAVTAIVGTAAVGVATIVWNARPAAQSTKATP
jgi:hypothetical protein